MIYGDFYMLYFIKCFLGGLLLCFLITSITIIYFSKLLHWLRKRHEFKRKLKIWRLNNGCPYPVSSKYRYGDQHPDKPDYYCIGHNKSGEPRWAQASIGTSENNIAIGSSAVSPIDKSENCLMIGKWPEEEKE